MTTTMNKSKLRGDLDGGSGSIVITAGSEGRGQRAEGRGQTADSRLRQQTQTADSDTKKAARHHCPAADKIKRN